MKDKFNKLFDKPICSNKTLSTAIKGNVIQVLEKKNQVTFSLKCSKRDKKIFEIELDCIANIDLKNFKKIWLAICQPDYI